MRNSETIKREIKELETKIISLKKELDQRNKFILMYMFKSGKHTFVLQPKNQVSNLLINGWKVCSKDTIIDFMNQYDF